ncbi:hypothetical protein [Nitratireductor basaltis]|uniref:hypothetical protein n=1 Tax=Nitratireductor basaltis TaxID=472175 RepID=UPI0009DDDF43|nr:hypothetical protein [Nitratireductor basaltis]
MTTLDRIYRKYGEGHLRLVLTTIREAGNNLLLMDETGFWAVSDMVRKCQPLIDRDASALLELWDVMPSGERQFVAQDLRGIVPIRFALNGMLYERIVKRFGPNAEQLDLLDDRRDAS